MPAYDESRLHVVDHPLVQHKLSILRDKNTSTKDFRELVTELAIFEGYEALRDLPLEDVEIETPLEKMVAHKIAGKKIAIIPILRAGLGMVDGISRRGDPRARAVLLQVPAGDRGAHLPDRGPDACHGWLPHGSHQVPARRRREGHPRPYAGELPRGCQGRP